MRSDTYDRTLDQLLNKILILDQFITAFDGAPVGNSDIPAMVVEA